MSEPGTPQIEHGIPIAPLSKRAQAWKLGMVVTSRTVEPNQVRVWRTK